MYIRNKIGVLSLLIILVIVPIGLAWPGFGPIIDPNDGPGTWDPLEAYSNGPSKNSRNKQTKSFM